MISTKQVAGLTLVAALISTTTASLALANETPSLSSLATQAKEIKNQATAVTEGLVNLNTADVTSLAQVPGVSDKIAQAITKYRETHGSFKQISDLANVEGIDAALVEKIAPLLQL